MRKAGTRVLAFSFFATFFAGLETFRLLDAGIGPVAIRRIAVCVARLEPLL
jgi:hypothetical protein